MYMCNCGHYCFGLVGPHQFSVAHPCCHGNSDVLYPFQFKFQFYALPFASCIQRKRNLRVTSRIRRTRPPLRHYVITITSLRNYNYVIPRTKWRLERSTAPYSSYTAAPRRTAPGPSNLCPSYLTTLVTIHSSYGCLVKKYIYK